MNLNSLTNRSRAAKKCKRVGRGPGSGMGKTSCRGEKGDGSRSGYKRRYTYEGGGVPLFKRLPTKGFSNARFKKRLDAINLKMIDAVYADGEVVNMDSLKAHGLISGTSHGIKILGDGELSKQVTFEVHKLSGSAKEKLDKMGIKYTLA